MPIFPLLPNRISSEFESFIRAAHLMRSGDLWQSVTLVKDETESLTLFYSHNQALSIRTYKHTGQKEIERFKHNGDIHKICKSLLHMCSYEDIAPYHHESSSFPLEPCIYSITDERKMSATYRLKGGTYLDISEVLHSKISDKIRIGKDLIIQSNSPDTYQQLFS